MADTTASTNDERTIPEKVLQLEVRVYRIEQALYGDERIGLKGILGKIDSIEAKIDGLLSERRRLINILIGLGIGLSITGGAGILTLVKVLSIAVGAPTP
ncbi:MAG: hypothetical protein M1546_00340 [Chloroflexi bacterium]|nr:hypothetical protein [Chloroflexota bacterium]